MSGAASSAAGGICMVSEMQRVLTVLVLAVMTLTALPANAAENDLVLSRFGTFEETDNPSCTNACGRVVADRDSFKKLARDLGQVLAPRFANPAETLGEAGFAVSLMTSLSFIDNEADYWQEAVEDRNPSSSLFTGHLQIRKGLPFSFEIASDMTYLFASEMFNLGGQVKWALNEGFYYFPDIAVRGTVNTLLGSEDLNMVTAGWDISISKAFDIAGVTSLAPYAGYQQLYVIASSRLLNAYPQDPRPPQFDDQPNDADGDQTFSPEFVFSQHTETINRFFLGSRLNIWVLSFTLEGVLAENVTQFTLSAGVDF
jgi:hypothetical protein